MRHACAFAFILASLLHPAWAAAPKAATKTFESWTASCNNLLACVVTGAVADGGDLIYLHLARAGGAAAPVRVKLVLAVPDGAKGPFDRFAVTLVDGTTKTALAPLPAKADKDDPSYVAATIAPGAASTAFIDAIRNAASLDITIGGESGTLDLKGLSAALRFIDDRQGRAGGPSALVAKGMTPLGGVPNPSAPPIVTPAPAGSAVAIAKPIVSEALLALALPLCDEETVKAHEGLEAWRLGPDRLLVAVPCQSGAYNFQSALFFTDAKGVPKGAANLPQAPGVADGDAANVVTNGTFDPKTLELTMFAKGRGIGDCGTIETWVWTDKGFALLSASSLDACPGAFSQDWPSLYSALKK